MAVSTAQFNAAKGNPTPTPNTPAPIKNKVSASSGGGGSVFGIDLNQILSSISTAATGGNVYFAPSNGVPDFSFHSKQTGQTTASAAVKQLYNKSTADIVKLQQSLLEGGFYGSSTTAKDIQWGVPDEVTLGAYGIALQRAGQYFNAGADQTVEDTIQQSIDARNKAGLNNNLAGGAPTITLTNPEDLVNVMQTVTQQLTGKKIDGTKLGNTFVQEFQAQQAAAQQAAAQPGTSVAAPNAQTAAENLARQQMPNQIGAHDIANAGSQFFSLLKGIAQ